jgi:hypothetical protein
MKASFQMKIRFQTDTGSFHPYCLALRNVQFLLGNKSKKKDQHLADLVSW